MAMAYLPPAKVFATDPSVIFTVFVVTAPAILSGSLEAVVEYAMCPVMLASHAMLFLVLYTTHSTKCVELNARDQRVANWFLVNACFLLFNDVVSGQLQLGAAMTKQYNILEPRYQFGPVHDSGSAVFLTSMLELSFQIPMCVLAYYGYHKGKSWRQVVEILASLSAALGVWYFYLPELLNGFKHLGGWPTSLGDLLTFHKLFYWLFGYWLGFVWVVVPFHIIRTAFLDLSDAVARRDNTKKRS